jgi:hypothetical protein
LCVWTKRHEDVSNTYPAQRANEREPYRGRAFSGYADFCASLAERGEIGSKHANKLLAVMTRLSGTANGWVSTIFGGLTALDRLSSGTAKLLSAVAAMLDRPCWLRLRAERHCKPIVRPSRAPIVGRRDRLETVRFQPVVRYQIFSQPLARTLEPTHASKVLSSARDGLTASSAW